MYSEVYVNIQKKRNFFLLLLRGDFTAGKTEGNFVKPSVDKTNACAGDYTQQLNGFSSGQFNLREL